MKFISLALLAVFAAAQNSTASNSTANSTAPAAPVEPKKKVIVVEAGNAINDITNSTTTSVVTQPNDLTGTLEISQNLFHNPAAEGKVANHVVISWLNLIGASDDGQNVYLYGIAAYGDTPKAKMIKDKRCGIAGPIDGNGPDSLNKGLTTANCTLNAIHTWLQTDAGDFHQSAVIGLTKEGAAGTLKLASTLSIQSGFASYPGQGEDAVPLDTWQSKPVEFQLDVASALVMTGVTAAMAAMTF